MHETFTKHMPEGKKMKAALRRPHAGTHAKSRLVSSIRQNSSNLRSFSENLHLRFKIPASSELPEFHNDARLKRSAEPSFPSKTYIDVVPPHSV